MPRQYTQQEMEMEIQRIFFQHIKYSILFQCLLLSSVPTDPSLSSPDFHRKHESMGIRTT